MSEPDAARHRPHDPAATGSTLDRRVPALDLDPGHAFRDGDLASSGTRQLD